MALDILKEKGVALDRQGFTWRELAGPTISKLNDDAFTRVRIILMNGIEMEAMNFGHAFARINDRDLRLPIARVRRAEKHQQTLINWLFSPDHSPLETTLAYEQVAIEVTASVAQNEPDPYMAQVYRFGLLEDFDHLYRYAALYDRIEGKDPNYILQCYTDIRPGRPTVVEHRDPMDDLREHYDRTKAQPLTKLNALTIMSAEQQTLNYYSNVGPQIADPVGRMLYAEISSIEEQHVTQYESLLDPNETWLEKWVLHEANEVYNYWSCMQQEKNKYIKSIWERFLAYELGHLHFAIDHFQRIEKRDAAEILPETLPEPVKFESHREFVRETLRNEVDLRAKGPRFVDKSEEGAESVRYREKLNSEGSPSEIVADGYRWTPGTELKDRAQALGATVEGRVQ